MTTTNTAAIQSKAVRRVVVLQADASGGYTPVTIFEKRSARKKQSRNLRPAEKAVRRLSKAAAMTANSYTARHERSNEKKKDGWQKDLGRNLRRAAKKGRKDAKIKKLSAF